MEVVGIVIVGAFFVLGGLFVYSLMRVASDADDALGTDDAPQNADDTEC